MLKLSVFGDFSCRYFPLSGLNTGEYGSENLQMQTIFTQFEKKETLEYNKWNENTRKIE